MKAESLLLEIEDIVQNHGYRIIKDRGNFRSDHCIVEGDKMVVINKLHPVESQISILLKLIYEQKMNNQFIKPKVRSEIEKIWKQTNYFDPEVFQFEII